MKKIFSKVIVAALVFVPGVAFAAATDVTLGATVTTLSVNSATVTVAGTASTTVESITVDSTTFDVVFASGSNITITAPDISVVSMTTVQPMTTECAAGITTLTINASSAATVTIRPSATACSTAAAASGGGGTIVGLIGGGGGGSSTYTAPVTAPTATVATQPTMVPAPSSKSYSFSRNLTIGSEGDEVITLQTFLVDRGFLVIPTGVSKGYFGSLTRAALSVYQSEKGISPAVGYFGPLTRASINGEQSTSENVSAPSAPSTSSFTFTRNLTVGVTGEDSRQLQLFLNANGFVLADSGPGSPGNETDMFGGLTRSALAKFQAANGIEPPAGYFGPITRGFINPMMGN
jgi:peptidoglycan hydrolase-like protein with peptidoglycan-binding domain